MIFLTAVESVLSVVLLIALGFVLRQRGWFADTFAANISRLIMNIALPASIFVSVLTYLHRDQLAALSDGLIYGVASLLLGYPMAWLMVKVLKVRPGRRGVFINTIVNANTIFIHNAQHFGLSDLHQMRGRVGRSNKKAFCYFITPNLSELPEDSRKRMQAIAQFTDLGSGIHIAMKDLEIRGAGDLLGGEQSGFINDIGFDAC
mgnify:CR=1 FL=1